MSILPNENVEYISLVESIFSAGADRAFAYNKRNQKSVPLTREMEGALHAFRGFATPEEYIGDLWDRDFDPVDMPLYETAFRRLVKEELLLSRGDLVETLLHHGKTDSAAVSRNRITTVAWITRDRPESLLRSVRSFANNFQAYERNPRIAVFDDTDDETTRAVTIGGLRQLSGEFDLDFMYAGPAEKHLYIEALNTETSARGVPPQVVEFALSDRLGIGHSTGANRNAAMLATIGELILSLDDDVRCEISRAPSLSDSPRITSAADPTSFYYFPDRNTMLESLKKEEQDALEIHEEALGLGIAQWLYASHRDVSPNFDGLQPVHALDLLSGQGKTVVSTIGLHGDCGLGNPLRVVEAEGDERDRVMASAEIYRSAKTSREVQRSVSALTIGRCRYLMGYAAGYDNRSLLPPFVPVGRNQDGIFQQTLQICFQDSHIAYLPYTVFHDPPESRLFDEDAVQSLGIWPPQILLFLLRHCEAQVRLSSGQACLRRLGDLLSTIGALDPADFRGIVNEISAKYLSRYLTRLEDLLMIHNNKPAYWADDMLALISSIEHTLRNDFDVVGPQQYVQSVVKAFGELLVHWPAIVGTARKLSESGYSPLVEVSRIASSRAGDR